MKKFKKIIKRILIAILIFVVGGIVLTKCSNCGKKDEASVAYADTFISRSSLYTSIDYQNNYSNVPYFNVDGVFSTDVELYVDITLENFVFTTTTFEVIFNSRSNDNLNLFLSYNDGSYNSVIFNHNDNIYYLTFDFLNSVSYEYAHLQLRFYDYPQELDCNFNVYTYAGSYVPGYGQGLAAGLQQGNAEGYNKGIEDSQYGAFKGATVDIKQEFSNNKPSQTFKNLTPNYVYQGINTLNLNTYYDDIEDLDYCTFTINFKEPYLYDQTRNRLFFTGDLVGLTEYATIIKPDNKYETYKISYEPGGLGALINEEVNPILISKIEVTVGRPTDLGKFWLNSVNTGTADYNYGYNQGYKEGLNEGDSGGYKTGYDKGYAEGEAQGYANAVSEGASSLGLFTGAVALIKVFFQLVTSFLETKIAGDISLGLLVVGLPAAFMIVNLAIGLVKKLLGAKGASEGDDDG